MPVIIDPDFAALACGVSYDEGVVVAYIPPSTTIPMEYEYKDGRREFIVYKYDTKVVDMLPFDKQGVKWWQVREAARSLRLDMIEPIFACAAEDFRLSCVPRLPRPKGYVLAFRQYGRGPWVVLDKKQEKEADNG
jgi:hypothetical protein